MLEILPIIDDDAKNRLFSSANLPVPTGKVFYALVEDGEVAGGADIAIGEVGVIRSVAVLPEKRGKGRGDFFTRSLIFKLGAVSEKVVVAYESDYFLRFGFRKDNGVMTANKSEIHFPHDCGKE